MSDEVFCDRCDYRLDLHPRRSGEPEEWECEATDRQQEIVNRFLWSLVRGPR